MSDNQLIQSLTTDPAVKQALLDSINAKRAELEAQLAELDAAEAELGAKSKSPKGRPRGKRTGPSQRQKILTVLAENKGGLKARELVEKTGIDSKVLQTTLSNMKSKYSEIKTSGKSKKAGGDGFVYAITRKGISSQKDAAAKAAEKAAAAE